MRIEAQAVTSPGRDDGEGFEYIARFSIFSAILNGGSATKLCGFHHLAGLSRKGSSFHFDEESVTHPGGAGCSQPGSIPSLSFTAVLNRCLQPM